MNLLKSEYGGEQDINPVIEADGTPVCCCDEDKCPHYAFYDGERCALVCGGQVMYPTPNEPGGRFVCWPGFLKQRDELQASVDLHSRMMARARELWLAAHPEVTDRWPDGADNVVWLIEQLDAAWEHLPCPSCGRTNAHCKCEPEED